MSSQEKSSPLLFASGLGALGVVFGDIGTSPLYTLQTVLGMTGAEPAAIYGAVSLLVWTLIIVTTIKYAGFAMRIDNEGEGGILALMALLGVKRNKRPMIVAVGLFGAALIYGDGAITPAISVLSALEGLTLVEPSLTHYVLPLAVAILLLLFAIQPLGTAKIGRAFGPIMLLWFIVMAALGISGIVRHPAILWALNPYYGIDYLLHSHGTGFLVLGGVFLCVTGAEALYADMGHFGPKPIKFAWGSLVFPSLVLNYAGQGALVLSGAPLTESPFYRLCPPSLTLPLVILSTLATIIASQSIITGAFSMTRQAIQLDWMPRLKILQTSEEGYGQIYIGAVNWTLMVVTIALALAFKKSEHLASAYGIAVSATMLMTTALLFIAMREIWGWSLLASGVVAGLFATLDTAFFVSNLTKLFDGGYVPLILAALVYLVMYIWHKGVTAVANRLGEQQLTYEAFMDTIGTQLMRPNGTAVFLTRAKTDVPPVLLWYVRHSGSLHREVLTVTLETASVPFVAADKRLTVTQPAPDIWSVTASHGFMERPNLPALMAELAAKHGCTTTPEALTYFIGTERIVSRRNQQGLPRWIEGPFALMLRNCARVTDYLRVPSDQVVDLGRQVSI